MDESSSQAKCAIVETFHDTSFNMPCRFAIIVCSTCVGVDCGDVHFGHFDLMHACACGFALGKGYRFCQALFNAFKCAHEASPYRAIMALRKSTSSACCWRSRLSFFVLRKHSHDEDRQMDIAISLEYEISKPFPATRAIEAHFCSPPPGNTPPRALFEYQTVSSLA